MLTYLLILFVIALALAPLIHFLPGKRQREVARMREYAAVHGMFVEFREVPRRAGTPVARTGSLRNIIYYGKRLPAKRPTPIQTGAWIRAEEGFRSVGRRLPAPAQLQDLPADIVAASVDESSCGVYWGESLGEEGVEQIRRVLEGWQEGLLR